MADPKGFLTTRRETPARRAEREGLDVNEAVMAAAHG